MAEPQTRFVFEAIGALGKPLVLGDTPGGTRRVIPIEAGGPVEGERLRGRMVGGHDWQFTRPDGVTEIDATYLIETEDSILIQCRNRGLRRGPAEVMARMARGEDVDPDAYYFRTAPIFAAPLGKYAWLNESLFLCIGARYPDAVRIRFYEVL